MQIIRDGKIVHDDWRHLANDEPLPAGKATISLTRWLAEKAALQSASSELGLRLRGEDSIDAIVDDLKSFGLIAIEFPTMTDGRGFSLARLLRERYGYTGEIRARGDFIRDQMFFLSRVGVNAFECHAGQDLETFLPALSEYTVTYQAAADPEQSHYRRRGD